MKRRNTTTRLLGAIGLVGSFAMAGAGCEQRLDDINTIQPGYVRKAIFLTDDEWYYRRTITDAETTNSYAIEGTGDITISRIKFRIEENRLVAYQPHEALPGTNNQDWSDPTENFEGSIIASWPIDSHFDAIRRYSATTGNEYNVLEENKTDRPWHEREYMRVDFGTNEIADDFFAGWSAYETPLSYINTSQGYRHCDEYPTDTACSSFSDDYLDIGTIWQVGMDTYMCWAYAGYSYAVEGCGFGEAHVRESFSRIKEKSDYIPRDYPDSYVRKGPDGQPLYDDETGEVQREQIYDRFGMFRIALPTRDRSGFKEAGRLYRAMLFNLWDRHTDEAGNDLEYAARTAKPIIYYLNAEYPPRWRQAAAETAFEYNRILKSMVADLQGASIDSVPDMFEIRDNDCNEANIKNYISNNPDLAWAADRVLCPEGECEADSLETRLGIGNLKTVCTSLTNATRDDATGTPDFEWQRVGDVRYKMLVWLNNPQQSGWGGYGPMHADPITGETISASAFIRGYSYEIGAAVITDYIEFINDEKTVEEVIYGQDIRKQAAKTARRVGEMSRETASPEFSDMIASRMASLGSSKQELLRDGRASLQQNARLERLESTRLVEPMIQNEDIIMATQGRWLPGQAMPEGARDFAKPSAWMDRDSVAGPTNLRARNALANAGFCFLNADFDPHWAGLAMQLRNRTREERYQFVGNMLIKHVLLHELGHNFGLAHNFEGSYDALNYFDEFWANHWATDEQKLDARYDEKRNTSVMEYMSLKGAYTDRLGKYDEAALRFAYGNQVQVFADSDIEGGFPMRFWRYQSDYKSIPEYLCPGCSPEEAQAAIQDRQWVDFDPQNPPANEVPYLFCDNYFNRRTPFCSTFDFGSNQREIFANYYSMWSDYFFFNNFIRDRLVPLSWGPGRAMMPAQYAMLHWATVGQYLYYFQALDSEFVRSELGQDMLTTVAHGLNFATEVIATPTADRYCETTQQGPPGPVPTTLRFLLPYYFYRGGVCDPNQSPNTPAQLPHVHMPLGDGRPASLGFTDDYEDYSISFVGSYFDKRNMLWMLGWVRTNLFPRFDWEGGGRWGHRKYDYSVYRLFEEEIRDYYGKIINLDPYFLSTDTIQDLGSYWCRDPENRTTANMGYFEPARMLDPSTGAMNPGPSSTCTLPATIYPSVLTNMPYSALAFAHVVFSSPYDTALDMGKSLKVYVVGADDDFPAWNDLPPDELCSCVDDLTGLEYRAVRQPEGIPDSACTLVDRACEAQNDALASENLSNEYYRERWRAWMERLEYARQLARWYDE